MTKHQFKTNINCSGCIAKVTDTLDAVAGKDQWQVDTMNPQKILTISNDEVPEEKIVEAVIKAGFKIETIHSNN